jgi:hypothetical protein
MNKDEAGSIRSEFGKRKVNRVSEKAIWELAEDTRSITGTCIRTNCSTVF